MNRNRLIGRILNEVKLRMILESSGIGFDIDTLYSMQTIEDIDEYCRRTLGEMIGKGSSRIVYKIDNERCIKIAYNSAGIMQNKEEGSLDYFREIYDIFPMVYARDTKFRWIICEYVRPATESDFYEVLGMKYSKFRDFVTQAGSTYSKYKSRPVRWDVMYLMIDNDRTGELHQLLKFMTDNRMPAGDIERIPNWGRTKRNGRDIMVLLDSGLSRDVFNKYYCVK